MITVAFLRHGSELCGVTIRGHAEYADSGQDIVCAAVSSAVQLTANTVTEIFKIPADVSAAKNTISIRLPEQAPEGVSLLEGLLLHLREISKDFPGTIRIKFTEV